MPNFAKSKVGPNPNPNGGEGDPNAHYETGATVDSSAFQKRLQMYSVGGAADALQGGTGAGVEMLTNFLFFDDYVTNFSGLCDQYAPGRTCPPFDSTAAKPCPEPNETAGQYERPVYAAWKNFGL